MAECALALAVSIAAMSLASARRRSGVRGPKVGAGRTHTAEQVETCGICFDAISPRVAKFVCDEQCNVGLNTGWTEATLPRSEPALRGLPNIDACTMERLLHELGSERVCDDATVELACGHRFHARCIRRQLVEGVQHRRCPICTRPLTKCAQGPAAQTARRVFGEGVEMDPRYNYPGFDRQTLD